MTMMKLSEWAVKHNIAYITAYRWFKANIFPVHAYQTDSGTILVEDEDPTPQIDTSSGTNDAMSLFLKKTVEFSKNNSTVEDFAAYVISNFTLKINGAPEAPRYSRQKPKSEDVQKHFQQFITKSEKPKPNSFVLEPETLRDLSATETVVAPEELVANFGRAISTHAPVPELSPDYVTANFIASVASVNCVSDADAVAESMLTRSVDLNSTPQQINYTGSDSHAFSTLTSAIPTSSLLANNSLTGSGIVNSVYSVATNNLSHGFTENYETGYVGTFQPTPEELKSATKITPEINLPRKRGRKPTKR